MFQRELVPQKGLVWYVSYGSNMWQERFLTYLQGGKIPGTNSFQEGSRNRETPQRSILIDCPLRLYFARFSQRWNGGIAFIEYDESHSGKCVAWLIQSEQYKDIYCQENGLASGTWDDVDSEDDLLYGKVIRLDDLEGVPALTFTSPTVWDEERKPSEAYLHCLMTGLMEHGLSKADTLEYINLHLPS